MAEYIKKDELLKFKADVYDEDGHVLYAVPTGCIVAMPPADVAPVAHGRWEVSTDEWFETDVYTCSKCRESYVLVEGTPKENLWHYCPNCGAQMHEDDFCSYGECREGKDEK